MDSTHKGTKEFLLRPRNRRQFLWLALGTTVGVAALPIVPAWASDRVALDDFQPVDAPPDFVAGAVLSTTENELILQTETGQNLLLERSENARLYSGIYGRVATFGPFITGDRIGAQGFRTGDHMAVKRAGSIFTPVEVTIGSVDPKRQVAMSDSGSLDLSRMNLPDAGTVGIRETQISAGQRLSGLIWTHPITEATYLAAAVPA